MGRSNQNRCIETSEGLFHQLESLSKRFKSTNKTRNIKSRRRKKEGKAVTKEKKY